MKIVPNEKDSVCKPGRRRLTESFRPVSADMRKVEQCLAAELKSVKAPIVRRIVDLLLESPGKRIRPVLVLLSAGAVLQRGGTRQEKATRVKLAAAVELIHMASLVHDDLIDGATVRHHEPTVNRVWGGEVSVNLGDYLCAHAFRLVADCGEPVYFSLLGSDLSTMCEGEMLQVMGRRDLDCSERYCLDVIEKKTASFFASCCEVGAVAAGVGPGTRAALRTFGHHLGIAFQILDDCRDVLSDQNLLGKQPAQDWLAGDATLPLLHVATHAPHCAISKARQDAAVSGGRELEEIREAFFSSNGDGIMGELARSHVDKAKAQLAHLPASDCRLSLDRLADYIAESVSDILSRYTP